MSNEIKTPAERILDDFMKALAVDSNQSAAIDFIVNLMDDTYDKGFNDGAAAASNEILNK